MTSVVRILLMGILCVLCAGCEGSGPPVQDEAPVVGVFTVLQQELRLSQTFAGRVVACNTAEIRPQVGGIVLTRTFEEGSFVKEGDILYEIDPDPYKAALNKASAREKNLANLAKRQQTLLTSKAVSRQDYEDSYYEWQQSRAELDTARLNLRYCTVKAPLTGQVGKSAITMGALVVADQPEPMATIHQLNPIFVDIFPAVPDAMQFLPGGKQSLSSVEASLILEGGQRYTRPGFIKFIDNHVREDTNTLSLRLQFDNPDYRLLPGMFVRATLMEKQPKDYLLVPHQAVFRDSSGQTQVWVVKADNSVELRPVTASQELGNAWVVWEGLSQGESVITEGHLRVTPGSTVNPRPAGNVNLKLDFLDDARQVHSEAGSSRPGN